MSQRRIRQAEDRGRTAAVSATDDVTAGPGKRFPPGAVLAIALSGVALAVFAAAELRPSGPVVSAALAVAVFLLVVVPFNAAYREVVRTQHTTLGPADAVRAAPATFVAAVLRPGTGLRTASVSAGTFAKRVRHVDSLAVVVQRTARQVAYRPVSEVLFAPLLSVVPTAVWVDKPLRVKGYLFRPATGGGVPAAAVRPRPVRGRGGAACRDDPVAGRGSGVPVPLRFRAASGRRAGRPALLPLPSQQAPRRPTPNQQDPRSALTWRRQFSDPGDHHD